MSDQMFEGLPPEESTPPYRRVTPESLLQDELRKARARIEVLEGAILEHRKYYFDPECESVPDWDSDLYAVLKEPRDAAV